MSILKSFIVFEGLDGAGTTTQIRNLAKYYEFNKREYTITCEPTSNPIGELVRKVLQKKVETTPEALAFLYAADRTCVTHTWTAGRLIYSRGDSPAIASQREKVLKIARKWQNRI